MERHGLLHSEKKRWTRTSRDLHLSRQSPLNSQNHNNWRQLALLRSQLSIETNLHYSAVITLSADDYQKLYHQTVDFLDATRRNIIESKDEELACFAFDLFKI